MTVLTIRDKDKRTVPIQTYGFEKLTGTTSSGDYASSYLVGETQRITEYDKDAQSRRFKNKGKADLIMNPVNIVKSLVSGDWFETVMDGSLGTEWYQGNLASNNLIQTSDPYVGFDAAPSWVQEYATQKALAKLGSPEVVDFGQFVGEMTETVQFLRNPVKGLVTLANKQTKEVTKILLKRRTTRSNWGLTAKSKATLTADVLADTTLAYKFGYKPLMQDLDGITTMLTQQSRAFDNRIRSVGGVVEYEGPPTKAVYSRTLERSPISAYFNYSKSTHWKASTKYQYQYNLWMHDAYVLAKLGLSPTQWLSTAWAVTPLSFVVDWGLDVSTWLKAFEPKPQIRVIGGCSSLVTTERKSINMIKYRNSANVGTGVYRVPDRLYQAWGKRKMLNRSTVVPPSFVPCWTREFSGLSKVTSSIALAWALRPKILRRGLVYQDFGL